MAELQRGKLKMVILVEKNGVVSKPIVHPLRPHHRKDRLNQNYTKSDAKHGPHLYSNQTC
jgi:hypothetical protein